MPNDSAIPTLYAGVQFRSRLEARWAAFFDQLAWKWEYEPIDLKGYIPDFVMTFHKPLVIEVKPELDYEALRGHCEKIDQSGWDGEVLIVGARLFDELDGWYGFPVIGLLREKDGCGWDMANLHHCTKCGSVSFHHASGGWSCRVKGCYDGNSYLGSADVSDLWRGSGNVVQWRPKQ